MELELNKLVKNIGNLALSKLKYIFGEYNDYKSDLINYSLILGVDKKNLDDIVDKLLIVFISHTPYYNEFVKRYAEIKSEEIDVNNKINIFEFIKIGSKSKNNDLHLERLDLVNGYVDIREIKEIYKKELVRVKVLELCEKAKKKELPDDDTIKKFYNDILEYLKNKIKFKYRSINFGDISYKGEIPFDWHPPCIRGILNDILSGGSPPHSARRSLVVYLFAAKFKPTLRPKEGGKLVELSALDIVNNEEEIEKFIDEVVELFKNVEDFDEKKTRYYIMHNIGYKVGHQRFTHCEYCKNWKNKDLNIYCKPDELCKKCYHPLDYLCYKLKNRLKRENNANSKS
ncbi:hypothetical protein ACPB8Q_00695 [Methanocaldococcus indicus]|uniref:hypothetical protein n=1 Tax=Methanocaldococcus indicus TaxID=213231 RepID=UPI003C6D261A